MPFRIFAGKLSVSFDFDDFSCFRTFITSALHTGRKTKEGIEGGRVFGGALGQNRTMMKSMESFVVSQDQGNLYE